MWAILKRENRVLLWEKGCDDVEHEAEAAGAEAEADGENAPKESVRLLETRFALLDGESLGSSFSSSLLLRQEGGGWRS